MQGEQLQGWELGWPYEIEDEALNVKILSFISGFAGCFPCSLAARCAFERCCYMAGRVIMGGKVHQDHRVH